MMKGAHMYAIVLFHILRSHLTVPSCPSLNYSEVLMTTLDLDESGEIGFHEFEQVFGGMAYPGDKRPDTKQ